MLEKKRLVNTFPRIDRNLAIGLAITLFGFFLRFHRYDSLPSFNWTLDEFAFAWSGMSLIQEGVPTSWSFLSPSDDFLVAVWEKTAVRFRFVTPWFDHPPLFGLIVGATAILGGAREFFDCTLSVIRIPSLALGTLSIILLYWLALRLTNPTIAVIASLIFATNPNTVFLSRLAISENLLSCISLGVMLLFLQYRETGQNRYLNFAIVFGSMAILAKVTGIYIIASIAAFLLFEKQWKYSLIAIAGAIAAFAIYYLYGAFYDFQWFLTTLQEHKNRFSDFAMLGYLILPKVFFEDGWLTFSWLTLLLVARSNLKQLSIQMLIFPVLIYTVLLIFSGAQSHYYAWYTIPYYPFLFIVLAIFLDNFRKEPDFITACTIFIFLVVWSVNLNLKETIFSSPYGRQYFILSTSILLGGFFFQDVMDKKIPFLVQFTKIIPMIFFVGLLVGNCNLVLNYTP